MWCSAAWREWQESPSIERVAAGLIGGVTPSSAVHAAYNMSIVAGLPAEQEASAEDLVDDFTWTASVDSRDAPGAHPARSWRTNFPEAATVPGIE